MKNILMFLIIAFFFAFSLNCKKEVNTSYPVKGADMKYIDALDDAAKSNKALGKKEK